MKGRFFIFLLVFTFFSVAAKAQKGEIYGIVKDEATGERIPFASVAVFGPDSWQLASGSVSDDKGKFVVDNLNPGEYSLVISFIGYASDTINSIRVLQSNSRVDAGELGISPSVTELQEVEVQGTAATSSRKIDRQTYRASDFETAQGGTAVDVLNKLPSIAVDPDGTVSVRGATDFMVYLNGKPTQMEASVLLGQISAVTIDAIDVITVPTSRYDAQGKGGIINITTKKSGQEGWSVSVNGLAGGAPWGNVTDKYSGFDLNDNRLGAGINLIFRNDKLTFYGGLNHNDRHINGSRTGDARLLQTDGTYYHMVASGERPEWFENYSANAGFDYTFNDRNTLSASYFYGHRTEGRSAYYVYNNFYGAVDKKPVNGVDPQNHWIYNPNTDERIGIFHAWNADYTTKFSNQSQLAISLLYEHSELTRELDNRDYAFDKPADQFGAMLKHFKQSDDTPLDGFRISADYEKEFDNGDLLRLGLQPQWVNQAGGFVYDTLNVASMKWGTNAQFNNHVDMSRSIYAAYSDYSGKWGKLGYIAGLRFEYSRQSIAMRNPDYLNIFDRPTKPEYEINRLDVFPTLHLNYALNERDALIFAASRRINRPVTKEMAPFLYRRHYEVYVVGDPELKPENITNLELTLNKKLGAQGLSITGFYRGTDNAVFRVNTVFEEENVLIRSYTNSGNVSALGAEINTNFTAGKSVKFFLGGSLYNFRVEGNVFGYREDNQSTNWTLKGNTNIGIKKSLKFTLDFDLKSATVTTQGRDEMRFFTNAALNYTPAKLRGWDFSAKVLDILSTNIEALNTRAYNMAGKQIFYQEVEYDRFGPIVELSAVYTLNMNGKGVKKADSTFGKEQF